MNARVVSLRHGAGFFAFWGQKGSDVSIGALIAIVVLVVCVVALVFSAASPAWLPFVLIGSLAVAILLAPFPIKWGAV